MSCHHGTLLCREDKASEICSANSRACAAMLHPLYPAGLWCGGSLCFLKIRFSFCITSYCWCVSSQLKTPLASSSHQVWQAVRASSAAPYYLDDFRCGSDRQVSPLALLIGAGQHACIAFISKAQSCQFVLSAMNVRMRDCIRLLAHMLTFLHVSLICWVAHRCMDTSPHFRA